MKACSMDLRERVLAKMPQRDGDAAGGGNTGTANPGFNGGTSVAVRRRRIPAVSLPQSPRAMWLAYVD